MHLPTHVRSLARSAGLLLAASLAAGCVTETRNIQDPVLQIQTAGGSELGVSTDYGVLFLGHTARSGELEITAWFGDGPSIEPSVIEPLGGGLFTAQTEIELPQVALTFQLPEPGTDVTVIGRRGRQTWLAQAKIRQDPRVTGLLISIPSELQSRDDQVGAGVYVGPELERRLVGLVSGRLELRGQDGVVRTFLTVIGPDDTWRLVAHNRSIERKKRYVYRDDVL